jgi:hypothetical protein
MKGKINARIMESGQFDKDKNFICPTCKKPLKGIQTNVSESLIALEKHTTQKHKVQCCSEECTAKFYDKQQRDLEDSEY